MIELKNKRICLINTPSLGKRAVSRSMAGGLGFDGHETMVLPPLDLAVMASQLRLKGHEVVIIDADPLRLNDEDVLLMLKDAHYDVIISTLSLPSLYNDCSFIAQIKGLSTTVAVKTMVADRDVLSEILRRSNADYIIHGECELTISDIVEGISTAGTAYISDNQLKIDDAEYIENLDDLPIPAWDLIPFDKYTYPLLGDGVMTMQTSRGCPFPCSYYCPYPLVEGNVWRKESPERVYRELSEMVATYGIRKILFRDATFTLDKDRIHKICDLIIKNNLEVTWWCETRVDRLDRQLLDKMKKAGCAGMNIGVETGDQKVMEKQAKRGLTLDKLKEFRLFAQSIGMKLHFLLSKGFPDETRKSFVDTYELIMKLRPESLGITVMTPYPGTKLFAEAQEKGWIESTNWSDYGGHQFVMHTDNLSRDDFYHGLKFLQLGNNLVQKSCNGSDPSKVREVEKQLYTELLIWATGLDELQAKLRPEQADHTAQSESSCINTSDSKLRMSIIIPTFNRKEQLWSCLNRLANQSIDSSFYEVIVVDDGSTDGTGESLEYFNLPYSVKYFYLDNSGPAAARNYGIKQSEHELIAFIGDDIMVTPDFVAEHISAHQEYADQHFAILGRIDWPAGFEVNPFMEYITGPSGLQFNFGSIKKGDSLMHGFFYTSNISLKKSFLLKTGEIFNTEFYYAAYEDIELAYRLVQKGMRIIYHPEAMAYHDHHMDLRSFLQREEKVGEMSVILGEKHPELVDLSAGHISSLKENDALYSKNSKELIETTEKLQDIYYPRLKQQSIDGINLGDKLVMEVLNPLYKHIFENARNSGMLKKIASDQSKEDVKNNMNEKRLVSIIIPVFNELDYTIQCLEALATNTGYEPYEVIIIDNASTDGTGELLEKGFGGDVRVIANKENLGFSKANNQGAKAARGEYLVFLNNDTVPQPGWLERLVEVADTMTDVAIVGSKLLNPDNTIQHAGVVFDIVENDLFIWHIYRNFDQDHPAVNSLREFNAVTAACILVKKNIFFEVGMFDEVFLNGYEDVDLCFKARSKGYRVIYNPQSSLYHYETSTERPFDHATISKKNAQLLITKWDGEIISDARTKAAEDGFRIETNSKSEVEYCPLESVSIINNLLIEAIEMAEQSNYHEALQIYRKILQKDALNEEALKLAGETSRKIGELTEAAGYIKAYLQFHPADLETLCSYSEICHELGDIDEAKNNVEKTLLFEPNNERALCLKDKLVINNEPRAVS